MTTSFIKNATERSESACKKSQWITNLLNPVVVVVMTNNIVDDDKNVNEIEQYFPLFFFICMKSA